MSKNSIDRLKFSGGVISLVSLTLAIIPAANAEFYNGSNHSGFGSNAPYVPVSPGFITVSGNNNSAISQDIGQRLSSAQSNYDKAASALASAATPQPVVSSGPARFSREAADLASCGCFNPDVVAAPDSAQLVAARTAEAEAAAELIKVKAEARQFLESAKNAPVVEVPKAPYRAW